MRQTPLVLRTVLAACAVGGLGYWAGTAGGARGAAHAAVPAAPSAVPSARSVAAPSSSGADPLGGVDLAALGSKLAAEKAAAGASSPSVSTVFAAIEKKLGLATTERFQVYAGAVGATFCDRIATASDVYVVVCEFADEAAATRGVAAGTTRSIPRREVLRVRSATVSIHRTSTTPACEADAKKIRDLVVTL